AMQQQHFMSKCIELLRNFIILSVLSSLDFEASFIRLIDKVTNGSRIEINQTGTTLYYQPGLLYGGSLEHDCSPSRGIGYYLESLLCLAPFMKHPLKIVLRGVTNDQVDPSVSNKV
uniref:RNA 3'-terminal phosphate cyclase domain-containing protein n=1 Tax=Ficedula albicollis TaxID=59894 RepID=A0A803VCB0_FICAL